MDKFLTNKRPITINGDGEDETHSVTFVSVSLENVTYMPVVKSVNERKCLCKAETVRKKVLDGVSTSIEPFKLSAWMGPSGSGKTSLISVAGLLISDINNDLSPDTKIRVNGSVGRVPKRYVSVVWQEDLLLSNLTVHETILFAAKLKSPLVGSKIDEEVVRILNDLGLESVKQSLIGGIGSTARGISGGERKRVAVAIELVSRPSVLLLDEPTSGLDATTAMSLMHILKNLASKGHSVAVAIHQPRTAIFEMFDSVLLLSRGQMVFDGLPSEVQTYLESHPKVIPLPKQTGIADWIMDTIIADERRPDGPLLPQYWNQNHITYQRGSTVLRRKMSSLQELRAAKKYETSFFTQLRLLIIRSMKQQRGERVTAASFIVTILYILFTVCFWWRLPNNTSRIYERKSLFFFLLISQGNSAVTANFATAARERDLIKRERSKKMYSVLPFFMAKTISEMTNTAIFPMFYMAVIYWSSNLRPGFNHFMIYLLAHYFSLVSIQSLGVLLSVLILNLRIALLVAPVINIFLMILGGFYSPFDNIPIVIRWCSWLSVARYGYSALVINEFMGLDVPCAVEGNTNLKLGDVTDICPLPGEFIVKDIGLSGIWMGVWVNIGMLALMQFILRLLAYFHLRRTVVL